MRILGVDYGDKRTGLALSDPTGIIALGLEAINTAADIVAKICDVAKKNDVALIVIGLPKNMDGTEGDRAKKVRDFGGRLKKASGIEIAFKDERLSSVSANRVLDEANIHWSKRRDKVDTMSAQIILQTYLDMVNRQKN